MTSDLTAYIEEYGETNIPLNLSLFLVSDILDALNDLDQLYHGDDTTKTAFPDLRREIHEQTVAAVPQFGILIDREMKNENAKTEEMDFEVTLPEGEITSLEGKPTIDVKAFLAKYRARQIFLSLPYAVVFNVLSSLTRDLTLTGLNELDAKTVSLIHDLIVSQTVKDFPESYPVHFGPIARVGGNDGN